MLSKPLLLGLTTSLLASTAQTGCSTQNLASQGVDAPLSLQHVCIEEGAGIINISSDQVHVISATELGNGSWDISLMLGARQGICLVDLQGTVLSIRGKGGTLY